MKSITQPTLVRHFADYTLAEHFANYIPEKQIECLRDLIATSDLVSVKSIIDISNFSTQVKILYQLFRQEDFIFHMNAEAKMQAQNILELFSTNVKANVLYNLLWHKNEEYYNIFKELIPKHEASVALCVAAAKGEAHFFDHILKQDDNSTNIENILLNGKNSLHIAAEYNHPYIIEAICEHKAIDVNIITNNYETALYLAVKNKSNDSIEKLLAMGADISSSRSILFAFNYCH